MQSIYIHLYNLKSWALVRSIVVYLRELVDEAIDLHLINICTHFRLCFVPDYLSFFLFWSDTRSLRMPALRPASQAGPMRNPREGTSVVLRDTIRLTLWCV